MPSLKEFGATNDLLRSPSDGDEFVIVWGVELRQLKTPEGNKAPVIAFEKVGKEGKRYVARGYVEVVRLTENQLKASVFPPSYALPF